MPLWHWDRVVFWQLQPELLRSPLKEGGGREAESAAALAGTLSCDVFATAHGKVTLEEFCSVFRQADSRHEASQPYQRLLSMQD